ncbi:MAG: MBL fold metallo-hydrolase [Pseudonocardiaceae bacterium]|nr:MBL fold metallo-hydrolase [Pseudonocardiaceae bacterium]
MAFAGLNPKHMSDLLVTHHHVDHMSDLGYLPLTAWVEGRTERINIYGPPPMHATIDGLLQGYAEDLAKRAEATGRHPFLPMVRVHEVTGGGVVFRDEEVEVEAAVVDHRPFEVALAYRITARGKSVVISGDTAVSPALIRLATGADVLVHEVVALEKLTGLREKVGAPTLGDYMKNNHTSLGDVAAIAQEAGVGMLVLSHLLPHDLPEEEWLRGAGDGFDGKIVVGADLMEIEV